MFIQLNDLDKLNITEGSIKEVSFDCTTHDELLDKEKKIRITIPKAYLCNAKILKDKKQRIIKSNNEQSKTNFENVRLRLDFTLISDENSNYYKAEEIVDK